MDPDISEGCKVDLDAVRHIFEKLSHVMDFNFIELIVAGEDDGKENIIGTINMPTPGFNAIVMFYYSGNRFSYE